MHDWSIPVLGVLLVLPLLLACGAPVRAATVVAAGAVADGMAVVPAGELRPLFRGGSVSNGVAAPVAVAAFRLDRRPVTNADFLAFVREHPRWRRSGVARLFAEAGYLRHWKDDLDPGGVDVAQQPVTHVSWFAAKAFATWKGRRLPTTDEWELAAAAGFATREGRAEPTFQRLIARWYASPAPETLPEVGSRPPNVDGIQDLHGLIWEWTSDFNSALVTGDARGDTGLDRQLFCGGGAAGATDPADFPGYLRYGFRSSLRAAYALHNLGFRCASDLPTP